MVVELSVQGKKRAKALRIRKQIKLKKIKKKIEVKRAAKAAAKQWQPQREASFIRRRKSAALKKCGEFLDVARTLEFGAPIKYRHYIAQQYLALFDTELGEDILVEMAKTKIAYQLQYDGYVAEGILEEMSSRTRARHEAAKVMATHGLDPSVKSAQMQAMEAKAGYDKGKSKPKSKQKREGE